MSKFDAYKWIKDFKSRKFLNEVREPKSWDSQFAMKAIEAYEANRQQEKGVDFVKCTPLIGLVGAGAYWKNHHKE